MNKFGIKVYGDGIYNIDSGVNSINYCTYKSDEYRFRVINWNRFGISLKINKR